MALDALDMLDHQNNNTFGSISLLPLNPDSRYCYDKLLHMRSNVFNLVNEALVQSVNLDHFELVQIYFVLHTM